jgi:hypothetical protein
MARRRHPVQHFRGATQKRPVLSVLKSVMVFLSAKDAEVVFSSRFHMSPMSYRGNMQEE